MAKRFVILSRKLPQFSSLMAPVTVIQTRELPHGLLISPKPAMVTNTRFFSQDAPSKSTVPPTIPGLGHMWPNPFKIFKNFFLSKFVLPKIDPDFNFPEFMKGALKAIEVISHLMSKGDYSGMKNFVEPVIIASIEDSLKGMSIKEQLELAVEIPDIMVSFPYSVDTYSKVENDVVQRRIDVVVVCHVLKGWGLTKDNPDLVVDFQESDEVKKKVQFLNYQFSRTYDQSVEGSWQVTGVHHFKPNLN